jgi:hypothetical protein
MARLVVKARVLTVRGDPVYWETPAHSVDGSDPVGAVAARFRNLYAVEQIVGFTFLDPAALPEALEL